jgi:hypothetical protein
MCKAMGKTFETKWKKRMIGQANNQVPTPSFTQTSSARGANRKVNLK